MSRGLGPRLLAELSSDAAMCSLASDLASLPRWAAVLPCVPWPRASLPCYVELRRCYVFLSFEPCLPTEVGSGADICPMAPGSISPRGELWCCHVPHAPSSLWTTGIKKGLVAPGTQLGSHVSKERSRVTEASVRRADRPLQFGSTVQR
jgi:hypothetical protein